jgi:hypothetical protein
LVEPSQAYRRDLRQPGPRRLEFRAMGGDQQHRQARRALDHAVEKLARAWVDPVQVFAQEQNRLPSCQTFELVQQCGEKHLAFTLRADVEFGSRIRQRQQLGQQLDFIVALRSGRHQRPQFVELFFGRVGTGELGCVPELSDEGMERAVLMMGRAEITQPRVRLAREAPRELCGQP